MLSIDIDECAEGTHNCHMMSNASCFDTDGSFYCNCSQGFEGNGTFCDGILFYQCFSILGLFDMFLQMWMSVRVQMQFVTSMPTALIPTVVTCAPVELDTQEMVRSVMVMTVY